MRVKSGGRRRPVQIYSTDMPAASAGGPRPRAAVVGRPTRPPRPPRALSWHTVLPTGGPAPPVGNPNIAPVLIVRGRGPRRWPPPIVLRPQLGAVPNRPPAAQVRPRPPLVAPDPWRSWRYRTIASHPPGRPVGLPGAHVAIVRVQPPRRGPSPPIVRPLLGRASIMYPRPPAIVRPPVPKGRPAVAVQLDSGAGIRPIVPGRTVLAVRRPAASTPRLPGRSYQSIAWSGQQWPRMRRPRPMVVPYVRPAWRPRVPVQMQTGSAHQTAVVRPLVIRAPAAPRPAARPIAPAPRYPLASPALHGPMPRPFLLTPWRAPSMQASYRPAIVRPPIPAPTAPPGGSTLPPDLVAACIAWIRQQAAIVAALGDSPATPRLFADVEARSIDPPYLGFAEPEEDESYESADRTGLASASAEGTLIVELVGPEALGRLGTRQLAEVVAAALNDAPLTFGDGVLVYLRRTERRFPVFRETGSGKNRVVWKRWLEFKYLIERWAPQF